MHYLLILGADALLAVCFVFQKKYQSIAGTSACATITFNSFVGLVTLIIFTLLGMVGVFQVEFSPFSVLMAFIAAFIGLCYTVIGFKLLRAGNMPLYTMFLMTGGMLVPYIFGICFLDEAFSMLRFLGVIFIILAVIIFNTGAIKPTKGQLLMCAGVFLLNGFMSVTSKLHQINTEYSPVNSESFIIIMSIAKILLCIPIMLMMMKKSDRKELLVTLPKTIPLFIVSVIADGGSYYLQLIGAKAIPAGVLYPLVTAGSIIFSAFAGMIAFRERPSKNQWIAMTVCLAGTCMFI